MDANRPHIGRYRIIILTKIMKRPGLKLGVFRLR